MNVQYMCPHCSSHKSVHIGSYSEDGSLISSVKVLASAVPNPLTGYQKVLEVLCEGCGTLFHPDSAVYK